MSWLQRPRRSRQLCWLQRALVCLALSLGAPAAWAMPEAAPPAAARTPERLALAVVLDGQPMAQAVVVERDGASVRLAAADLRALGIAAAGDQPVALDTIPGLSFRIDAATQTLVLTRRAPPRRRLRMAASYEPDPMPVTPSGWGGVFSYDMTATVGGGRTGAAGLVEGVVYGPLAQANVSAIVDAGDPGAPLRVRRLDSAVTIVDADRLRRITLGDFITTPTGVSRPIRLAGVQVSTDFSLQPDLVTFPIPALDGGAATPSAAELVVDGSRHSGDSSAGRFAVSDVPIRTGVNSVTVPVRDALGRERLQTVSAYVSPSLLMPGLSAYAIEGGFERTGYATTADRYRSFAIAGSLKHGVSGRLTLTGHTEGSARLVSGGGGAIVGLDRFGLVELTAAGSAAFDRRRSGSQLTLGWERVAHPVSFSVRAMVATPGWQDLAARSSSITRSHSLFANAGFALGRWGSLGASYADLGRGRVTVRSSVYGPTLEETRSVPRSRFAAATYSVRIARRFDLIATVGGDPARRGTFQASIGLLLNFGPRGTAYAGGIARDGGGGGARAEIASPALFPGEFGYRASADIGSIGRLAASAEYEGSAGHYEIAAERVGRAVAVRGSARGSLVFAEGGTFASDRLTGGFALVDASGERDVTIYRDNRPVGATDRHGRLLVANLAPYERTRLSIDPAALPLDAASEVSEVTVKPGERAGVPVRFAIRRGGGITLRLVDAVGRVLPAGSRVTVDGGDPAPVGFDGAAYLAVAAARGHVVVMLPDGARCEGWFARAGDARTVVVTCRPIPTMTARQDTTP